jgi:RNA polymerase sigma factor (sigma-70 family)
MDIALANVDYDTPASYSNSWAAPAAESNDQLLEDIVRRYGGMVFRICLGVTHHRHDAEDAAQSVFLNLARRGDWSGRIRSMGPWLQRVAYRLSLDQRRSARRRRLREERHAIASERYESVEHCSDGAPDADELRPALMEELDRLPERYRSPLILFYFGGLSREQIAARLHCNTSTLGVQLHRARKMLAARLAAASA